MAGLTSCVSVLDPYRATHGPLRPTPRLVTNTITPVIPRSAVLPNDANPEARHYHDGYVRVLSSFLLRILFGSLVGSGRTLERAMDTSFWERNCMAISMVFSYNELGWPWLFSLALKMRACTLNS